MQQKVLEHAGNSNRTARQQLVILHCSPERGEGGMQLI